MYDNVYNTERQRTRRIGLYSCKAYSVRLYRLYAFLARLYTRALYSCIAPQACGTGSVRCIAPLLAVTRLFNKTRTNYDVNKLRFDFHQ